MVKRRRWLFRPTKLNGGAAMLYLTDADGGAGVQLRQLPQQFAYPFLAPVGHIAMQQRDGCAVKVRIAIGEYGDAIRRKWLHFLRIELPHSIKEDAFDLARGRGGQNLGAGEFEAHTCQILPQPYHGPQS